MTADSRDATSPLSEKDEALGLFMSFNVAYLDGMMEHEQAEIRSKWETVRDYLIKLAIAAKQAPRSEIATINAEAPQGTTRTGNPLVPEPGTPAVASAPQTPLSAIAALPEANELATLTADARRFRALLKDPVGARHLLHLLQQGKGDEAAFRSMIDRIDASREAAHGTR